QARTLEAPRQGEGWIFLDWKAPSDGGAVASYKLERRERPSGDWSVIGLAIESEATLTNQERGKDWEYRVIAVNKAGEGAPSNTVAAVV
ncbi:fibronectin type III domain-containing protein, partial [Candidatus Sumerlaeota bacterium]|nr:fibronectin type III domain-containing protein [Candidatus Sumerlaeota bacterium]